MKTTDEPIIVEQTFRNSVVDVWNAITEIGQMRQWFFENIPNFKTEVGFETQFNIKSGQRKFLHLWKVTEVTPLKKIKYNWKYQDYAGDSFVTFELFPENELTNLKLSIEIVENFPQDIPEFKRESCIREWTFFIN